MPSARTDPKVNMDAITADAEDKSDGYAWEGTVERSWDTIQEDETGQLKVSQVSQTRKRQRREEIARNVRKGLIRYTYLVVDLSTRMGQVDWKPYRAVAVSNVAQEFVTSYFDQNPISQLGVVAIKNGVAERLSDLSANPKNHVEKLKSYLKVGGSPSIQNALEMCRMSLRTAPSYGSREVILVYGSLTTTDPGDIYTTIKALKKDRIRVSFIGIGAEMHLLKTIAQETNGKYFVALSPTHMREVFQGFTLPSASLLNKQSKYSTLVQMGFPERRRGGPLSLCADLEIFTTDGYLCPRCLSKHCDIPTTCKVCNLPLVSSPHLARSYHHLFPIEKFKECKSSEIAGSCFSCGVNLSRDGPQCYQCPTCHNFFCETCDLYIHDSLHNCPGDV